MFNFNRVLSFTGWIETVERFNLVLAKLAKEEELLLVDLNAALAGRPEYFLDFVHFTPAGHEIIARTLADALLSEAASSSN